SSWRCRTSRPAPRAPPPSAIVRAAAAEPSPSSAEPGSSPRAGGCPGRRGRAAAHAPSTAGRRLRERLLARGRGRPGPPGLVVVGCAGSSVLADLSWDGAEVGGDERGLLGPSRRSRSAPPQRRYQAIASALTPAEAAALPRLGTTGRAARVLQRAACASAIRSSSRYTLICQAVRPTN